MGKANIKVRYLYHSGFVVETAENLLQKLSSTRIVSLTERGQEVTVAVG